MKVKHISSIIINLLALQSFFFIPREALAGVCTRQGTQIICQIKAETDCSQINDYPYAKNLFCPASFSAANIILNTLKTYLVNSNLKVVGSFEYYQTPGSNASSSQTLAPCMTTTFPSNPSGNIKGAGKPLCNLIGYVTSPATVTNQTVNLLNPLPSKFRLYPAYFSALWIGNKNLPLNQFKINGSFDGIVSSLGADAAELFVKDNSGADIKAFYPAVWKNEANFFGISGGGGGGWGAELALASSAVPNGLTLLTFGGGGGGGLTSSKNPTINTDLASGGGGGMQFANGLGLGSGGSKSLVGVNKIKSEIQYSYYNVNANGQQTVVNIYDPQTIAAYQTRMSNLKNILKSALNKGNKIILKGGGGMGAGTEYLTAANVEIKPHALSTQAGFKFKYEFYNNQKSFILPATSVAQDDSALYQKLGNIYQTANNLALAKCKYENYNDCICPTSQAITICLAKIALNTSQIPHWLGVSYCPKKVQSSGKVMISTPEVDLSNALPAVIYFSGLSNSNTNSISQAECVKTITDFYTMIKKPFVTQ